LNIQKEKEKLLVKKIGMEEAITNENSSPSPDLEKEEQKNPSNVK
jgi:hypothetical protein